MKTRIAFAALSLLAFRIHAQTSSGGQLSSQTNTTPPQDTPYAVVENDGNSRVWERTTYELLPSGEYVPHVHRYQEVATGLNYQDENGQWQESSELIEPVAGGAVASHGQHKVTFAADLATSGGIDVETPDGQRLQSDLLGLAYFDRASGQTVFIAVVTNSIGQLISSNQVWYDNAFSGVQAGVRYSYSRAGFEQDVIIEAQPPAPETFGLNSATTVLQAYTEFLSPPTPALSMNFISVGTSDQLPDQTLSFRTMKIGHGRAFLMGNSLQSAPVAKQWANISGRHFLIEEVSMPQIADQLQSLPPSPTTSIRLSNSVLNVVSARPLLPSPPLARAGTNQIRIASGPADRSGFVLDYASLNSSQTNWIFRGDTTYYISGPVNLYGTNIFEGDAVIKFTNSASAGISVWAAPTFQTAPYRPAIFTSMDDNSVGEIIAGSTGSPTNTGATYLYVNSTAGGSGPDTAAYKYLRFAYANSALQSYFTINPCPVQDCQFVNCAEAMKIFNGTEYISTNPIPLYNDLFSQCGVVLTSACNLVGEHITVDAAGTFYETDDGWVYLTNCILTAVSDSYNASRATADHCLQLSDGSGIYQTVGAGNYYLAANSANRNAGTTNVNPNLLAELAGKTTYPPTLHSNVTISADTVLGLQVQRDTDIPDLGFHYDPVDHLVDTFWFTNANMTIAPGATIATYNSSGLLITDGSSISSVGTPTAPIWFTRYSAVQEEPLNLGTPYPSTVPGNGISVNSYHATNAPSGLFKFTKFSCPAGGGYHLTHTGANSYSNLLVQSCEFWGGENDFSGYSNTVATVDNSLFERSTTLAFGSSYTNVYLSFSNNLFWNGACAIRPFANSNSWFFFNNAFDHSTNTFGVGIFPQNIVNAYNAYIGDTNVTKRVPPIGSNDVLLTSFMYQSGPLGDFYQPTNSLLINKGSVTADLAGLYHYTTTTNEVKETNSVVDIGYHYVAVDNSGNPIDSDEDGVPDYAEDVNGNGLVDSGETDWQNASDLGLKVLITRPQGNSIIP